MRTIGTGGVQKPWLHDWRERRRILRRDLEIAQCFQQMREKLLAREAIIIATRPNPSGDGS
jgi:hypothetical protein